MATRIMMLVCVVVVYLVNCVSAYVIFQDGHDYTYSYTADSDVLGLHNITTVVKIRIRHVNSTSQGTINQLFVDSFYQRSQDGQIADNPSKWDLSRPFLFQHNENGEIHFVHYKEEDEPEVINLKKALTSVFSTNVKLRPGSVWSYAVNETDHSGTKEHQYFATRHHDNGITLKRFHRSTTNADKHHQQETSISPEREIHFLTASDKVLLKNRFAQERSGSTHESPGFEFQDKSFGEFPEIYCTSMVQVKLENKMLHGQLPLHHNNLKTDSIVVMPAPVATLPLSNLSKEINASLTCIQRFSNKYAQNRTECVYTLKQHFERLHPEDLHILAEGKLKIICEPEDNACQDERLLFIDMLCQLGTSGTQSLLVKYVLRSSNPDEEEIRRVLFHFIGLKDPDENTVNAVWDICLGQNKEKHGTHNNTKQTHRSCLTLGALAKTLAEKKNSLSNRIVKELVSWVGAHDGSVIEPARHRIRRHVVPPTDLEERHRVSKMVLIEALGNTGHAGALGHILSYAKPNVGHSAWRRSGVHALRWFECEKSASALMDAAINDEYDTVREQAFSLYKKHPRRQNMSVEEENIVLSKVYTYPVVMQTRSKRSLADIFKKLSFKIELPGIDWSKTIGTSAIGASFGLVVRNRLQLSLKPLSGFIEIDVYNTAWVKGLLGILGKDFDIFKAKACYHGHIRYDINVLKDFGVNDVRDLANLFDKVVGSVRDPIVNDVEAFKRLIKMFKDKGIKAIIDDLVNIVRDLPDRLKQLVDNITEFVKIVSDYEGLPWVSAIKKVVFRIKYFVEDVRSEVMNFYNTVVDTITVTLPFAVKRIVDAIKTVVDSVRKMFKNPLQAISSVIKATLNIKLSVSMLIGAKQKLEETCFFQSGQQPYWMNPDAELKELIEDISTAITEVRELTKRPATSNSVTIDRRVGPGDGIIKLEQQEREIAYRFIQMMEATLVPMEELINLGKPFIDAYNAAFDVIRGVKKAYFDLKTTVEKSRSLIRKLFGPRFHEKFPSHRVDCEDSDCACGIFPSTVNDLFLQGVDIRATNYSTVVSPIVGLVKRRNDNEVIIIPGDGSFGEYEMIITNVQPSVNVTTEGAVHQAGQSIGEVASSQCSPSFIHLAMRKKPTQEQNITADDEYSYIDPTPFLERIFPIPRWIEDCNEYSLHYSGQTADNDKVADAARETIEDIERKADEIIDSAEFNSDYPEPDLTYRPPELEEASTNSFKESFQGALDKFKDIKQLFTNTLTSPNILDMLDVNKYTIQQLLLVLEKGGQIDRMNKFQELLEAYSNYLREQPIQHPMTFSSSRLRNILKRRNLDTSGSFEQMVLSFFDIPNIVCPDVSSKLGKGDGMFCRLHDDCLGVTCGVMFQLNFFLKIVKLNVRYNVCAGRIEVVAGNYFEVTYELKAGRYSFDFKVSGFKEMYATAELRVEVEQNEVILFLQARLCSHFYPICAKTMTLFDGIEFVKKTSSCVSGPTNDKISSEVLAMQLDNFGYYVLEANVGDQRELLTFLVELRVASLDALLSNPELLVEIQGTSFPAKRDFCVGGNIPIEQVDITPYEFKVFFMVGPVPMSFSFGAGASIGVKLRVGACFLSMTSFVEVTPFVGAKVYGSLAIDIGLAAAGLQLDGYLIEVNFQVTASVKFNKFPLDVGLKMDLVLVPLRLRLRAFVELWIFFTTESWSYTIWEYVAPSVRCNILDIPMVGNDKSPPNILDGCYVSQIVGQDPSNPSFILEVTALDEVSDIKRRYAIGSHLGGNDILDWTDMGGTSVVVPVMLTNGIPLFWTVKIKNSQGLESTAQCSLNTYDTTVPNGRVDASYAFSSHPHKLSASIVLIDDSPLKQEQYKAVGVGQGAFGNSIVDWEEFNPAAISFNTDRSDDLKQFSVPRRGRLTADPFLSVSSFTDVHCATDCINYGRKCISFDFDSMTQECLLHYEVEGVNVELKHSGTFHNYQRIIGHTSMFEYEHVNLTHGEVYFINARITNTLEYVNYLSSAGTLVDYTPPEPGTIVNASLDVTRPDGCSAAHTQRCHDVTWHPNHRVIQDGDGSKTVFNGHERFTDLLYTLNNHYISAHWDGFHDNETDIWGYTWAAGTSVCATDVSPYDDPHAHLSSKSFWTHHGLTSGLHLPDGAYYVTVQALNSVVYGGALVTTVCHSQNLIVDTTKPEVHSIGDYFYDEDFDIMFLYYNVSDSGSGIMRVDCGLGHTKYDVKVRPYSRHQHVDRNKSYIVIDGVGLQDGIPAWIRLRAVNNVQLFTGAHSDSPLLVDRTPPVPGDVGDGPNIHFDMDYQSDNTTICSHWKNFFDPDSGITKFFVGFSVDPSEDTALTIVEVSHLTRTYCYATELEHNQTYYATVVAVNRGVTPKNVNASSSGVLVDITPPESDGVWVKDGKDISKDITFTHMQSEVAANYGGFSDPESGISRYDVSVFVNDKLKETFSNGKSTLFEEHSFSLYNGDKVNVEVIALNGAYARTSSYSNGYTVDVTSPLIDYLIDSADGKRFQTRDDILFARWKYSDLESGVAEYKFAVNLHHEGTKTRAWPLQEQEETLTPEGDQPFNITRTISLVSGARYSVLVSAINNAQLSTTHESDGIVVDSTKPAMARVIIGLTRDDEEINDDGQVLHLERTSIMASWLGHDEESGILSYLVGVGTSKGDVSLTGGYREFGSSTHGHITGLQLQVSADLNLLYYVTVKAFNGAGMVSQTLSSKPIYVLQENAPGVVFDGRIKGADQNVQRDTSSIAINFSGFQSDACGIVSYEWAIGSKPGFSDVEQFSTYGIVMKDEKHGVAESNLRLENGKTYYSTVRAITGHLCHEDLIVASSDGILVDNQPPLISIKQVGVHSYPEDNAPLYQDSHDALNYRWDVTDGESNIKRQSWYYGSLPSLMDIQNLTEIADSSVPVGALHLSNSQTGFLTVHAVDGAGNTNSRMFPAITIDTTIPSIVQFTCDKFVSSVQPQISCSWTVGETESYISILSLGLGTVEGSEDLIQFSSVSISQNKWTINVGDISMSANENMYATVRVTNHLNKTTWLSHQIKFEDTPPDVGTVSVVTGGCQEHVACQISQNYVDISIAGFKDDESSLDRYEVCVGGAPGEDDVSPYRNIGLKKFARLDTPGLEAGSVIYITVKAFNKVGLSSKKTSREVTISPTPKVYVDDGPGLEDTDYQTSLSTISANWRVVNGCSMNSFKWAVFRVDGLVVKPFEDLITSDNVLIDDELTLENYKTYYVTVEIVDILHRTFRARTDGVSISIESPMPGTVMDGRDGDVEYQRSNTELHARWHNFGQVESLNPSQRITHYEVAVGSDVFSHASRENIHPFVNVGLNTSYTFFDLDLTAKTVRYFITVRANSAAGSSSTVSSNGIFVGYKDTIIAGTISVKNAQTNTSSIKASWSNFDTELPILDYDIGLSSVFPSNSSVCNELATNPVFDIMPLISVGVDSFVILTNLSLHHGHVYYVTVRGKDAAENCASVTSSGIVIDETKPIGGQILVGVETDENTTYVKTFKTMYVEWSNFSDAESSITHYDVSLYEQSVCTDRTFNESLLRNIAPPVRVSNDVKIEFEQLSLNLFTPYFVKVVATNGAGLTVTRWSLPIMADDTPPVVGSVKYGDDWTKPIHYQTSLTTIKTMIAIDHTPTDCILQKPFHLVYDGSLSSNITVYGFEDSSNGRIAFYNKENVMATNDGAIKLKAEVVRNGRAMTLAGFEITSDIFEGSYTATMQAAKGRELVSTFFISTDDEFNKFQSFQELEVSKVPLETDFVIANVSKVNTSETVNTSYTERTVNLSSNASAAPQSTFFSKPAVGFHIMGSSQNGTWALLFWGVGKDNRLKKVWIDLAFSPVELSADYTITFEKDESSGGPEMWTSRLIVANRKRAILSNIKKISLAKIGSRVWNKNDQIHARSDQITSSEVTISNVMVAIEKNQPCMFGKAFQDKESKIKEIWVGIGSKKNGTTDVLPLTLVKRPCSICEGGCDLTCDAGCRSTGFTVYNISLSNLTLSRESEELLAVDSDLGNVFSTTDTVLKPRTYYAVVKAVNYASETAMVIGEGITVDVTPPVCSQIMCLDPSSSMTEPSDFLGSNGTIGAFWDCEEDASIITGYRVSAGTAQDLDNIVNWKSIGLYNHVRLDELRSPLQHDHVYWVNVDAVNSAGLSSRLSCNVTADLEPPNTNDIEVIDPGTINDIVPDIQLTISQTSLAIAWNSTSKKNVAYYELEIETERGSSDILPSVLVGVTDSTGVEIADGTLKYRGAKFNTSLAMLSRHNQSVNDVEHVTRPTFYRMEPGRCTYQTLYGLSRSKIKLPVSTKRVCVLRPSDTTSRLNNKDKSDIVLSRPNTGENASSTRIEVKMKMRGNGSVLTGLLNDDDVKARYGCAASTKFTSYITDPLISNRDEVASRRVRGRFRNYTGTSFFIAPAGTPVKVDEPIDLEVEFDPGSLIENQMPLVMYYDPDAREWKEVCESCNECDDFETDKHVDWNTNTVKFKICSTRNKKDPDKRRMKRDLSKRKMQDVSMRRTRGVEISYAVEPTQYAVINVDKDLNTQKSCRWQYCDEYTDTIEYVNCNINPYREGVKRDVMDKVTFTCGLTNNEVVGVRLSYTTNETDVFARLFIHGDNSTTMMVNPSCYNDGGNDGFSISLDVRSSPDTSACSIPQAPGSSSVFHFYLIRTLGYLSDADAMFVVDCGSDVCTSTVSDVASKAGPPAVTAYVARAGYETIPIEDASQHENLVLVLNLTKTSIANGVAVTDFMATSEIEPSLQVDILNQSCALNERLNKDEGFTRLSEDTVNFYSVSPTFGAFGFNLVRKGETEFVLYSLRLRMCTKSGDSVCLSNTCTALDNASKNVLGEIYNVTVSFRVLIPAGVNYVALTISMVIVALVFAIIVVVSCVVYRKKKRAKVDNEDEVELRGFRNLHLKPIEGSYPHDWPAETSMHSQQSTDFGVKIADVYKSMQPLIRGSGLRRYNTTLEQRMEPSQDNDKDVIECSFLHDQPPETSKNRFQCHHGTGEQQSEPASDSVTDTHTEIPEHFI